MIVSVAPCTEDDLERLRRSDLSSHALSHHEERFSWQQDGIATYLLAWSGDRNVGRATLFVVSKYAEVRRHHPDAAEINALEANPQGQGIGTAMITGAEEVAARDGHAWIGLAVEAGNAGARRLYERLGYRRWPHGDVIDEWTEPRDDGPDIQHRDPCLYLLKPLEPGTPGQAR